MGHDFIISTTNLLEGYKVEGYLGICSERMVIGTGFFSEFFAGITDVFGGRSKEFEEQLKNLYDTAMNKLIDRAKRKGANGLVGVSMDIDEISGKNLQMFMISVYGTAVRIKNLTNIETDIIEEVKVVSKLDIDKQIKLKKLMKILNDPDICSSKFSDIFTRLIKENLELPLDLLLNKLNDFDIIPTKYNATNELNNYLQLYDSENISDKLNEIIAKYGDFTKLFQDVYQTFSLPDYKVISKFLDTAPISIIEEMILPVLKMYKDSYNFQDIMLIIEINNKLINLLEKNQVTIGKGMFNKDVWICSCNKKMPMNEFACVCGKGKSGLPYSQEVSLINTINFLKEIEEAFNPEDLATQVI